MSTRSRIHRIHSEGERLYQRVRPKLEPRHKGEIIAIEVESGRYLLGKDELEVALKAVKKFPGKKFSFFRIGHPAVHKLRLLAGYWDREVRDCAGRDILVGTKLLRRKLLEINFRTRRVTIRDPV